MNLEFIEATDLPDAWFQCVYRILDKGHTYVVEHGSYEGQERLEFDYITLHVKYPGARPLLPEIPAHLGIPNPVANDYLDDYLPYLMTSIKQPGEDYTYGSRLEYQIQQVIKMYKKYGPGTNQAAMSVSMPTDIDLVDPPCLRHIDTRIRDNKLHFIIYFRCLSGKNNIIAKVNDHLLNTNVEGLFDLFESGHNIKVVSVDDNFKPIWGDVTNISRNIKSNVVIVELQGAGELELTYDHRVMVYVEGEIIEKKVSELKINDVLLEPKGLNGLQEYTNEYIDLLEVCKDNTKLYVSNLSLDDFKRLRREGISYSDSWRDKKYLPFNIASKTFLYGVGNLKCSCQKQDGIDRMFKISTEMAYFMGLWLADGWYNNKGNGLRLVIEESNPLKLQRIVNFLKNEFDYTPSIERRSGCVVLSISILFLAELFKSLGFIHGSKIKFIPSILFSLDAKLIEELFIGWFSGDAGVSSSRDLISGFSSILKFLNEKFSIYSEKPRKAFFKEENRIILSSQSQRIWPLNYKTSRLDIDEYFIGRKVKKISPFCSEKLVYDISVNTNSHLFCCGQIPILVHNSWDLWGGTPANLGAIQLLKEYMAEEIGVEDGEMIASSKGMHLYDYTWELAQLRCGKDGKLCE